jgi:hypothetical protein
MKIIKILSAPAEGLVVSNARHRGRPDESATGVVDSLPGSDYR